jgi:hypothetical protein
VIVIITLISIISTLTGAASDPKSGDLTHLNFLTLTLQSESTILMVVQEQLTPGE